MQRRTADLTMAADESPCEAAVEGPGASMSISTAGGATRPEMSHVGWRSL